MRKEEFSAHSPSLLDTTQVTSERFKAAIRICELVWHHRQLRSISLQCELTRECWRWGGGRDIAASALLALEVALLGSVPVCKWARVAFASVKAVGRGSESSLRSPSPREASSLPCRAYCPGGSTI